MVARRQTLLVALSCVLGWSAVQLGPSATSAEAQARPEARTAATGATSDALARAEAAYNDIDFESTLAAAQEALREGGHTPAQLTRIYELLGVSAAATEDLERARDYFVRMLALDPAANLDDTVPPRLRAPFLEARGTVSSRTERLEVSVGLARARSALHVELTDPFQLAVTVRVHARLEGSVDYVTRESAAQPNTLAQLDGASDADRVEYWLEVVDRFGNQVLTRGGEFEPRVVGRERTGAGGAASDEGGGVLSEPWFWTVVGVVVVGAGVATGVVLGLEASRIEVQTGVSIGIE